MATLGTEQYYAALVNVKDSETALEKVFDDVYPGSTINVRRGEFYSACYAKALYSTYNLDKGAVTGIAIEDSWKSEISNLIETKKWLFEQTLSSKLINLVTAAVLPTFFYNVFDIINETDSQYEEHEFKFLYGTLVHKKMFGESYNTGDPIQTRIQLLIARWWLAYVVYAFQDSTKNLAIDFVNRLEVKGASIQLNKKAVEESFNKVMFSMQAQIRTHLYHCLNEGTGNQITTYVRTVIDELVMVRKSFGDMARIELKIDPTSVERPMQVNIYDKSKWFAHIRRIADSFSHQMYSIDRNGLLVPELETREIANFITDQVAFSSGTEDVVSKIPKDFVDLALNPRYFIDTQRVSGFINDNGMNVPNSIEGIGIYYPNTLKDQWFSVVTAAVGDSSVSALDLKQQMDSLHLIKGMKLKLFGENYEFNHAILGEMAMNIAQRIFSLIVPETSPTGNLQIIYENQWGTPLVNSSLISETNVTGLNEAVYQNVIPVISFLEALNIKEYSLDRSKERYIGQELFSNMYQILKQFGIESLKTYMLSAGLIADQIVLPEKKLYAEWTSLAGNGHAKDKIKPYGPNLKERFLIKSLFGQTSSSAMNEVLVRSIAITIAYKTAAIEGKSIITEFKE